MGRGLGWVTHRGPFQLPPFCDSVIPPSPCAPSPHSLSQPVSPHPRWVMGDAWQFSSPNHGLASASYPKPLGNGRIAAGFSVFSSRPLRTAQELSAQRPFRIHGSARRAWPWPSLLVAHDCPHRWPMTIPFGVPRPRPSLSMTHNCPIGGPRPSALVTHDHCHQWPTATTIPISGP